MRCGVEINKRISRRTTSGDAESESFSSRLRTLGRSTKLKIVKDQYQTKHKTPKNDGSEIGVCEKSVNKTLFIRFKNLFRSASVVTI